MAKGRERDHDKERFWRRMARLWHRSGLTVRAFCAERGLAEASFYAWRRILAQRDQQAAHQRADDPPRFVPVHVVPPCPRPTPLELVLGRGRVIRVTPGFDAATLQQLLAVVEDEPSC